MREPSVNRPYEIRPLTPDDLALERDFVNSLSPASLRQRTLGGTNPTDQQLALLLGARQPRHLGVAAIAGAGADARILGVARYGSTRQRQTAEFAVIVAETARGKGIATRLLQRLERDAAAAGYTLLEGQTFADNTAMLKLAREAGFAVAPLEGEPGLRRLHKSISSA